MLETFTVETRFGGPGQGGQGRQLSDLFFLETVKKTVPLSQPPPFFTMNHLHPPSNHDTVPSISQWIYRRITRQNPTISEISSVLSCQKASMTPSNKQPVNLL